MVRAPCCEKMGLKRGPWTPEEDRVLVAYISRYGHGNWRALPKQAGLLRCGKSCRLRWTNYLRPDIKRGNFTIEEEETIISLHELLGNRWSAIAARLPGRTDNEIKNVWHTHLKKRLNPSPNPAEQDTKRKKKRRSVAAAAAAEPISDSNHGADSPAGSSSSDVSSSSAATAATTTTTTTTKEECMEESFEGFPEIDESFWSDALSMNNINVFGGSGCLSDPFESLSSPSNNGDDMSFWLKVFMESGDSLELPDI